LQSPGVMTHTEKLMFLWCFTATADGGRSFCVQIIKQIAWSLA